MGAAPMAAYR